MTLFKYIVTAGILTCACGHALSEIVVCKNGCDYATIQSGIEAAVEGDTVIVESGTYQENIVIGKNIVLKSKSGSEDTIIEGEQSNPVVYFQAGELSGFHIRGKMNSSQTQRLQCTSPVGGIVTADNYSLKIIHNNVISNFNCGSGIYDAGFSLIYNNVIKYNFSINGGGIWTNNSAIYGNRIYSNKAERGGGIYIYGGNIRLESNLIYSNTAKITGGGIYQNYSTRESYLVGNTITKNHVEDSSDYYKTAGVIGGYYSPLFIINNIVLGNYGVDIFDLGYSTIIQTNIVGILRNKLTDVNLPLPISSKYLDIILVEPQHLDSVFMDYNNNNFRVSPHSLAIDRGAAVSYLYQSKYPAAIYAPLDIDRNSRIQDGDKSNNLLTYYDLDIGAFEYHEKPSITILTPQSLICNPASYFTFDVEFDKGTEYISGYTVSTSANDIQTQIFPQHNICELGAGVYNFKVTLLDHNGNPTQYNKRQTIAILKALPVIELPGHDVDKKYTLRNNEDLTIQTAIQHWPVGELGYIWSVNGYETHTTSEIIEIPWHFLNSGELNKLTIQLDDQYQQSVEIDVEIVDISVSLIEPRTAGVYTALDNFRIIVQGHNLKHLPPETSYLHISLGDTYTRSFKLSSLLQSRDIILITMDAQSVNHDKNSVNVEMLLTNEQWQSDTYNALFTLHH